MSHALRVVAVLSAALCVEFSSYSFLVDDMPIYTPQPKMVVSSGLTPHKLHANPTPHNQPLRNIAQTAADGRSLVPVLLPKLISRWLLYDYWVMFESGEL